MQRIENLRPQDVLVACKLFSLGLAREDVTFAGLAAGLGMSTSTAHEAAERCRRSQLLPPSGWTVSVRHLRDVVVVAVPRIFYAVRGALTCGTPTATWAVPVAARFKLAEGKLPVVWCEDDAPVDLPRGEGLEPLYPTAPAACRQDGVLYELLALADVMRVGSAAERSVAASLVDRRLGLSR